MTPEEVLKKKRKQLLARNEVITFLFRLVGLGLFIWLVFFVIFKFVPVLNDDMRPGIRARDLQLVYTLPDTYHSSDVVVYDSEYGQLTGRVVAKGGDTVEIADNQLIVNGGVTQFDNVYYDTPAYESDVTYPVTLNENEYFILADMREGGMDSRQFGVVNQDDIVGKVIMVFRRNNL